MRFFFLHNFRGFNETLLPLRHINFLVGENSTGKSSLLKIMYAMSRPYIWFSPEAPFQDEAELGGFEDMVSAWSPDKKYFQVGTLTVGKNRKTEKLITSFAVHTFGNREGSPYVARYLQFSEGVLVKLAFLPRKVEYKIVKKESEFASDAEALKFFTSSVLADRDDSEGFERLPKDIPLDIPIPVAITIAKNINAGKQAMRGEFTAETPGVIDLTCIAPIRTRPQRFYDGMRRGFSPEGDHTPYLLRRLLRTRAKNNNFGEKLRAFGKASGLFDTIVSHKFSRHPQSPFEILVRFPGADLNLSNVGYGVSQVLPLVVEFLLKGKSRTFAIQQPEVHLHPRAQAALGDLIAEVAVERRHRFILETHSDYLIDRCRLNLSKQEDRVSAQTIFFQRTDNGNAAVALPIGKDGRYPIEQPRAFRKFFVHEEMQLLEM